MSLKTEYSSRPEIVNRISGLCPCEVIFYLGSRELKHVLHEVKTTAIQKIFDDAVATLQKTCPKRGLNMGIEIRPVPTDVIHMAYQLDPRAFVDPPKSVSKSSVRPYSQTDHEDALRPETPQILAKKPAL